MTQQGFKKFRRRAHQQATPVSDSVEEPRRPAEDLAEPLDLTHDLAADPVLALPSTLPALWDRLERVAFDPEQPSRAAVPLASACRGAPAARSFDLLRTRLLQVLKARGWTRVAICAPTSGCGSTFSAVNLALSLARVPSSRTILMDLNFRSPGVADALGVAGPEDMAALLRGDCPLHQALIRPTETLAVGLNGAWDENAAEILHDSRSAAVLDDMIEQTEAETVLFDLPPMLEYDDAAAFLPQVDGVLLISDGTQTTAAHLAACEGILAGHAPLLGVVLNRGRATDGAAAVA
ncbi:CpsD/CapB family tyrosine-protein kinase [Phaeobacter sp. PT47_59]|uniref:CpsD/CapB family tyrosine-protein kinase n=1 Tax=Phaeobacter sp. PT47_59 TaxID=3029979 RepID=UPI0023800147|nr:CpsD/CapB family tyrosine-protein kinase [Phaeobacter sp. PT47_59]MDE4175518.1 CpsD/CapB family tyrosine-protein kinase [Phaeobacter sp. PT47_59]